MIKRATLADLPTLLSISQRSFEVSWPRASFEAEFMKQYSKVYMYTQDGTPVAYLVIWIIDSEGEIVSLAVDKGWRKQGFGSKLLNFALTQHQSIVKWHLEVDPNNQAAMRLYEKYHFKKVRFIKNYYGQDRDAIQMIRENQRQY